MMRLFLKFLACALAVVLSSCNYRHSKVPGDNFVADNPGILAFEKTVYAHARTHCIQCHGGRQQPLFAQDSLSASYAVAKGYADFQSIPASIFVFRTTNGHCGSACDTDGTEMERLIRTWWETGEKVLITPPTPSAPSMTAEVAIPRPGASATPEFYPMHFALPEFGNAEFIVEVEWFDAVSFNFRNPRLVAGDKPLRVKDIRIRVDDQWDPSANAYTKISMDVGAHSAPVLSSKTMIIPRSPGESHQARITFGHLAETSEPKCKQEAQFLGNVMPIFSTSCRGCHATGTSLVLTDSATACGAALQRTNFLSPVDSVLITFPLRQAGGHPRRALTPADARTIESWIRAERDS